MRTIPARELRNNSGAVLAEVEAGATIAVSRNGEPSAILVPPQLGPVEAGLKSGTVIPAGPRVRLSDLPRGSHGETIVDALADLRS